MLVKDAYNSIKDLPPHITFGGKRNQLLRMKGKISRDEYRKRRNSILISRGEKSKRGKPEYTIRFKHNEVKGQLL